jgi:predicted ATPase
MSFHFDRIVIPEALKQYGVVNGDDHRVLSPLSKINIFVGPNNSGKSRFLRELVRFKEFSGTPFLASELPEPQLREAEEVLQSFSNRFSEILSHRQFEDVDDIGAAIYRVCNCKQGGGQIWVSALHALLVRVHHTKQARNWKARRQYSEEELTEYTGYILAHTEAQQHLNRLRTRVGQFESMPIPTPIYFPVLRTLRTLHTSDVLLQRTQQDYALKPDAVFTGQSLYQDVQELLLGNLRDRETVAAFQEFISAQFFDGKELALIPKLKSKTLEVKIGDEVELPIHQLGDGIQAILILTFPLFRKRDEPLLAFFEEPELFMHPGIQRVFLNALIREFPNHQFFIATHSNHFLDITLDVNEVSVFTLRKRFANSAHKEKEATFEIDNVSSGHTSCLELLGVRNSSVFLSNCTIWVEGITDRRYLAHYLKLYTEHRKSEKLPVSDFKEDLHYSFVEYGGSNITHWSFLDDTVDAINPERLCARLFLIADRDTFETTGKAERHTQLQKTLKERFALLDCKEIENLLLPHVLEEVVASCEKQPCKFKDVTQDQYATKPLGRFIEEELLMHKRTRKRGYAAPSGTVSDKVNFCDKAIKAVKGFDDVSPEGKKLAERVYKFIAEHNAS